MDASERDQFHQILAVVGAGFVGTGIALVLPWRFCAFLLAFGMLMTMSVAPRRAWPSLASFSAGTAGSFGLLGVAMQLSARPGERVWVTYSGIELALRVGAYLLFLVVWRLERRHHRQHGTGA